MEASFVYGDDVYIPEECMDEVWDYIDGVGSYMISDKGRVWSEQSQTFLTPTPTGRCGHLDVSFKEDGERKHRYIHRMVAKAFIPNPNEYPLVRHLDDDPSHNDVSNLAWGTQADNAQDCLNNGNAYYPSEEDRKKAYEKRRTPIKAINLKTNKEFVFVSQQNAGRMLNLSQSSINHVLKGQRKRVGDYTFEYVNKGRDVNGNN